MTATWTAPRTWVTGEVVTASQGNEQWRDNMDWLKANVTVMLENKTLTSDEASVTFSTNVTGYAHLRLIIYARSSVAAVNDTINLTFNGAATDSYFDVYAQIKEADSLVVGTSTNAAYMKIASIAGSDAPASSYEGCVIDIPNYSNTSYHKVALSSGSLRVTNDSTGLQFMSFRGWWAQTAAITSITLTPASGNFKVGSRFTLYGLP